MRFYGNIAQNLSNALKSKDGVLAQEIIIDALATLIETKPNEVIKALQQSDVDIAENASKEKIVNVSSESIQNNKSFQIKIAKLIVENTKFYAQDGSEVSDAAKGSGGGANIVSSIADMISSGFKFGAASKDLKSSKQSTKSVLYSKVFGDKKKVNWLPIVVISGILVIGGIVVWRVTANKK